MAGNGAGYQGLKYTQLQHGLLRKSPADRHYSYNLPLAAKLKDRSTRNGK